jgi:hypothetical protein
MDEQIHEWLQKLKASKSHEQAMETMKAFAICIHASALHEAADALSNQEDDEADQYASIIRTMAEQADADYERLTK